MWYYVGPWCSLVTHLLSMVRSGDWAHYEALELFLPIIFFFFCGMHH